MISGLYTVQLRICTGEAPDPYRESLKRAHISPVTFRALASSSAIGKGIFSNRELGGRIASNPCPDPSRIDGDCRYMNPSPQCHAEHVTERQRQPFYLLSHRPAAEKMSLKFRQSIHIIDRQVNWKNSFTGSPCSHRGRFRDSLFSG